MSQGKVQVDQRDYRTVAPSVVTYDEKLVHVNGGKTTCIQTLTANISAPWTYAIQYYTGIRLPNAGFALPREAGGGLEMRVNLPYTTQGTTCPRAGQSLTGISVKVGGNLSADGKRILYHETGSLPEGMGTYFYDVNLQALRE